jgi:hypothetical protein
MTDDWDKFELKFSDEGASEFWQVCFHLAFAGCGVS